MQLLKILILLWLSAEEAWREGVFFLNSSWSLRCFGRSVFSAGTKENGQFRGWVMLEGTGRPQEEIVLELTRKRKSISSLTGADGEKKESISHRGNYN